jgi:hypothetical protein
MAGDTSIAKKHVPIVPPLVTLHKYEPLYAGGDCETEVYPGRR